MSENKIDRTGGQAFPQLKHLQKYDSEHGVQRYDAETIGGVTLRQWYAGFALQGLAAGDYFDGPLPSDRPAEFARRALELADALIAAEKESQT